MSTLIFIFILAVVAVLLVAGLVASLAIRARRSMKLREKFGPEYTYTLQATGNKRAAEEALKEREKHVQNLAIQNLDPVKLDQYQAEWKEIQAEFVDQPTESVEKGDRLITEVMVARGFPVEDFEERVADISVLHPELANDYRNAHGISLASKNDGVTTEDLRQAMIEYRSLFAMLLETNSSQEKAPVAS